MSLRNATLTAVAALSFGMAAHAQTTTITVPLNAPGAEAPAPAAPGTTVTRTPDGATTIETTAAPAGTAPAETDAASGTTPANPAAMQDANTTATAEQPAKAADPAEAAATAQTGTSPGAVDAAAPAPTDTAGEPPAAPKEGLPAAATEAQASAPVPAAETPVEAEAPIVDGNVEPQSGGTDAATTEAAPTDAVPAEAQGEQTASEPAPTATESPAEAPSGEAPMAPAPADGQPPEAAAPAQAAATSDAGTTSEAAAPAEAGAAAEAPIAQAADTPPADAAPADESPAAIQNPDVAHTDGASADPAAATETADTAPAGDAPADAHAAPADGAAAAHVVHQEIKDVAFSFEGPFGKFDQFQLQRGLQVYTEVCAGCHGMKQVPLRTLSDPSGPGLPDDQMRAYAKAMTIVDEETQEERPRGPTDMFPTVTGDGMGPDLSMMAKARAGFHGPYGTGISQLFNGIGGPEYIYSVLTGYTGETKEQAGTTFYENTAFAGGWISMPPPLSDDQVTFEDGAPADLASAAQDLSAFLMWTAEPKMMQRKQAGLISVLMLIVLSALLYLTNKRLWWSLKHGRDVPGDNR